MTCPSAKKVTAPGFQPRQAASSAHHVPDSCNPTARMSFSPPSHLPGGPGVVIISSRRVTGIPHPLPHRQRSSELLYFVRNIYTISLTTQDVNICVFLSCLTQSQPSFRLAWHLCLAQSRCPINATWVELARLEHTVLVLKDLSVYLEKKLHLHDSMDDEEV